MAEVIVLGRDSVGVVAESSRIRYYLTECCGASSKGVSAGVACRACYALVSDAMGGAAMAPDLPGGTLLAVYGDGVAYDVWKAIAS